MDFLVLHHPQMGEVAFEALLGRQFLRVAVVAFGNGIRDDLMHLACCRISTQGVHEGLEAEPATQAPDVLLQVMDVAVGPLVGHVPWAAAVIVVHVAEADLGNHPRMTSRVGGGERGTQKAEKRREVA